LSIINSQLKLNAGTYLIVDSAWSILLHAGVGPFRIKAFVAGEYERVGNGGIETEMLATELVEEVLFERVTQRDVLHFQE
jgi:hypothetical protein